MHHLVQSHLGNPFHPKHQIYKRDEVKPFIRLFDIAKVRSKEQEYSVLFEFCTKIPTLDPVYPGIPRDPGPPGPPYKQTNNKIKSFKLISPKVQPL